MPDHDSMAPLVIAMIMLIYMLHKPLLTAVCPRNASSVVARSPMYAHLEDRDVEFFRGLLGEVRGEIFAKRRDMHDLYS